MKIINMGKIRIRIYCVQAGGYGGNMMICKYQALSNLCNIKFTDRTTTNRPPTTVNLYYISY
jgi:hypothetical protein